MNSVALKICATGLALFTFLAIFCMRPAAVVVRCDVTHIKGQFIHQLALHNVPNETVKSANISFQRALKDTLERYARTHHVVILSSDKVLAGGHDITETIMLQLAKAMRRHS